MLKFIWLFIVVFVPSAQTLAADCQGHIAGSAGAGSTAGVGADAIADEPNVLALIAAYAEVQERSSALFHQYDALVESAGSNRAAQSQARPQLDEFDRIANGLNAEKMEISRQIGERPTDERIAFLRTLTLEDVEKYSRLLDSLFGLRIEEMDANLARLLEDGRNRQIYGSEEIWYSPRGGQQSSWHILLNALKLMDPQPGQLIVDIGSGIGRLGLLVGLLYPQARFVGLEIVGERVRIANLAAQELGFANAQYIETNLADRTQPLPAANHFYMFNPTTAETSEIVTEKLIELASTKDFRVYLNGGFGSRHFRQAFELVEPFDPYPLVRVYELRR